MWCEADTLEKTTLDESQWLGDNDADAQDAGGSAAMLPAAV